MIKAKLILSDEKGNEIEVTKEYTGKLTGKDLDEIETFMSELKTGTLSSSELSLLELNQEYFAKKK